MDTLDAVLADLPSRAASAEYYRFWWFPHTDAVVEWRASKVEPKVHRRKEGPLYTGTGLRNAAEDAVSWAVNMLFGFHLLQLAYWCGLWVPALIPLVNRLWQRVQFGRTVTKVDRSDRQFNFNCLFKQHVDEWAIPLSALPQAMRELQTLLLPPLPGRPFSSSSGSGKSECYCNSRSPLNAGRSSVGGAGAVTGGRPYPSPGRRGYRVHFPIEVRFVAPDDAWLSPAHGREVVAYIGVIAYKPHGWESDYKRYFRDFEAICARYGGRPHWAKDFHFRGDADFAPVYPRWADFKALRASLDPHGLFLNPWARRTLGIADSDIVPRGKEGPADAASSSGNSSSSNSNNDLIARVRDSGNSNSYSASGDTSSSWSGRLTSAQGFNAGNGRPLSVNTGLEADASLAAAAAFTAPVLCPDSASTSSTLAVNSSGLGAEGGQSSPSHLATAGLARAFGCSCGSGIAVDAAAADAEALSPSAFRLPSSPATFSRHHSPRSPLSGLTSSSREASPRAS